MFMQGDDPISPKQRPLSRLAYASISTSTLVLHHNIHQKAHFELHLAWFSFVSVSDSIDIASLDPRWSRMYAASRTLSEMTSR